MQVPHSAHSIRSKMHVDHMQKPVRCMYVVVYVCGVGDLAVYRS